MAKRTNDNTLRASWSKKEKDIVFGWPSGPSTKSDGHYLYGAMSRERFRPFEQKMDPSFLKELESRGYDLSTLRFSICKKEGHPRWATNEPQIQKAPETNGNNS